MLYGHGATTANTAMYSGAPPIRRECPVIAVIGASGVE